MNALAAVIRRRPPWLGAAVGMALMAIGVGMELHNMPGLGLVMVAAVVIGIASSD